MNYLLTLGIFDDGDVAVTFHIMLVEGPVNLEQVEELVKVATEAYGRTPPPHAQFWDCAPQPVDA